MHLRDNVLYGVDDIVYIFSSGQSRFFFSVRSIYDFI